MGDTIMISHEDCVVDFEPPLDYKEPEKCAAEKEEANDQKPKFKPFTGLARRLDEEITKTELDSVSVPNKVENEEAAETVISKMFKRRLALAIANKEKSETLSKGKENVESETLKNEPKFQPFTGKKYTLAE
ncbi:Ubiquitin fusion degradation protein [Corchorus olitorius]|uniref:Ubiquitin fusion degradation protein n=1 Tax=Corchorus olitorius TaxID=93759 RepID=A0A1R3HEV7_9ROSI|nr:Ubiquitin fusion degradation protein [Corchorus olitorius]